MKYDPKTAKKIAAKYGLSEGSIKNWKYRGGIPDKYKNPNYMPPAPLSHQDQNLQDTILELLQNEAINISGVSRKSGITRNKFNWVQTQGGSFTPKDLQLLLTTLFYIRDAIKTRTPIKTAETIVELHKEKTLNLKFICSSPPSSNSLYRRLANFFSGNYILKDEDIKTYNKCYGQVASLITQKLKEYENPNGPTRSDHTTP